MPPTNLDNIFDPRLYMIGAGVIELNLNDPVTGLPTGYFDIGNANAFEPTNSDERFKIFESRTRYRAVDADLLIRRNTEIGFNILKWTRKAIALYFQSTPAQGSALAGTAIVDEVVTTAVVLGSTYRLAHPGPITAVTAKNDAGPTTLDVGIDYEITDPNVPTIHVLPGAVKIAAGDTMTVSYTPTAYASGITTWPIGSVSMVEGAIRFIGDPPFGPRLQFDYWKCSFKPNGGAPLINTSNEPTPLQIIASVNSDAIGHPGSPIGLITELPA